MRPSASTSERRPAVLAALLALAAGAAAPAAGTVLVTAEDAVTRAFPPPLAVAKKTAILDGAQVARIEREAGTRPGSKIVAYYVATGAGGAPAGFAYLDTHLVRTLQETVLVVLDAGLAVRRVEVLSFDEPQEYLTAPRWLAQFEGRKDGPDLAVGRGIRGVAGATLSSRAVTDAVRRVLATHRAIHGAAAATGSGAAASGATTPAASAAGSPR